MARFDLNLLSALNALLSDRNVTRAAARMNVTQPTMSGMLQRLRYQFNDQLLVRNGREMELTPFGESLVEPVREALRGVELLMLAEPIFDPAISNREFTLMASDYCTSIFLSKVVSRISKAAPGVRLAIQPINSPMDRLISGEVDICIAADDMSLYQCEGNEEKLHSEVLFSDDFVCIVENDHPLQEGADLDDLLNFPHVGVEMRGTRGTLDTMALSRLAPHYKPNFVVADFTMVASLVAESDMVGVIQSRLARLAARYLPIRTLRPPFSMPSLNEMMCWHSRHLEDPAHLWLRELLRETSRQWQGKAPRQNYSEDEQVTRAAVSAAT